MFKPAGLTAVCEKGTPLIEVVRQAGIALQSACGGSGRCGRCRVKIVSGHFLPPHHEEIMQLGAPDLARGHRLACRISITEDTVVEIPFTSLISPSDATVQDMAFAVPLIPAVHDFLVEMEAGSEHNPQTLWNALSKKLRHVHHQTADSIDSILLENLPRVIGHGGERVRVSLRGGEVIGIRRPEMTPCGLAIDLGTTTLAGYLVDLRDGHLLAAASAINPQRTYGEDVMSRIAYMGEKGGRELRTAVTDGLNALIASLCDEPERIVDIVLVGNTAMHHILLGLPVQQLGRAPYRTGMCEARDHKAHHLGLTAAPGASVHLPPPVGGFVGSDHVAMILAAGIHTTEKTVLAVDIGTNTEVALVHQGVIRSTCCASGPAFEGGHISHGTCATTGAIHTVRLHPPAVSVESIGKAPPHGLCGSGILDAMAELLRLGAIDRKGRLAINLDTGLPAQDGNVVLVPPERTATGKAITISQKDVGEVQLAKAAVRAGIDILLEETGISWKGVQEILLTGGFGTAIDPAAAIRIGMLPPFSFTRIRRMKHGAGTGALRCLLSITERAQAAALAGKIAHLELMTHPVFKKRFGQAMYFP